MRILVVDDSRTMRLLVTRALRQAGFGDHPTVEAGNGIDAVDIIESKAVDLVLCDWNIPGLSGIEVLQRVRGAGNQIPFGFITSEGGDAVRDLAYREGAQFVMHKPFTAEMFSAVLGGVGQAPQGMDHHGRLSVDGVRQVLEELLVPGVEVQGAPGAAADMLTTSLAWTYQSNAGEPLAVVSVELALAVALAAGFGLLPTSAASDAFAAGRLSPELLANLAEVANVLVAFYGSRTGRHLAFSAVIATADELAPAAAALLRRDDCLHLVIGVHGYGGGRMSTAADPRLLSG
jgi:two-component system, chemotaxis family, chemotaxis protein CheY